MNIKSGMALYLMQNQHERRHLSESAAIRYEFAREIAFELCDRVFVVRVLDRAVKCIAPAWHAKRLTRMRRDMFFALVGVIE